MTEVRCKMWMCRFIEGGWSREGGLCTKDKITLIESHDVVWCSTMEEKSH